MQIVSGRTDPRGLVVHAGSMYWLETHTITTPSGAEARRDWLFTMPEGGGTPRRLAELVETHSNLAVGAGAVYVADGDPGRPTVCSSPGCLCLPGDPMCGALTGYLGFRLMRIPLSKRPKLAPVEIAHADGVIGSIAVHRNFVYFATATAGIRRVPAWGGRVRDVAGLGDWESDVLFAGSDAALATDGHALYWIAGNKLRVRVRDSKQRILLHLPVEPVDDDTAYTAGGLAVDARYVYFIEHRSTLARVIAVPKEGGHAQPLACEPGSIDSLAVDGHGVYFINHVPGAILRIPLPG